VVTVVGALPTFASVDETDSMKILFAPKAGDAGLYTISAQQNGTPLFYSLTITALPVSYIPPDCPDRQWQPIVADFSKKIKLGEVMTVEIPTNILLTVVGETYTCTDDVAVVRVEGAPDFIRLANNTVLEIKPEEFSE